MLMPCITFIRRHIPAAGLFLACTLVSPSAADAGDWMFRRSYFSHELPGDAVPDYPLPYSRSAYRPAIAGTTPGFGGRGAFRYNTVVLGSGRSLDVTVLHNSWAELQP